MTSHVLLHDAAHLWHPDTQHFNAPLPIHVVHAKGASLFDEVGNRFLDATSSWFTTVHGHCEDSIVEAIRVEAATLDHVSLQGFTYEAASLLAAALVSRLPRGLKRVFFTEGGSTAVDAALSMSLGAFANRGTPRNVIVAFAGAHHGRYFGRCGQGCDYAYEVVRIPPPHEGDTIAALASVLDERRNEVAALILEPLLCSSDGVRPWSERLLRRLRDNTFDAGVHLIADETTTGFGRAGPLFACEWADVGPDIICLSKSLTGGLLPLGAAVSTEGVYDSFLGRDPARRFSYGRSTMANPIACAAAIASLELLDEGSEVRRVSIEVQHANLLAELKGIAGVSRVDSLGTVAAVELDVADTEDQFAAFAAGNGVLLKPAGRTLIIAPPYCIAEDEMKHIYSLIHRFLEGERAPQ